MRGLAALLVAGVLLTGCAEERGFGPLPGPARIDVDTPELRKQKVKAGVEPCVPGPGESVDGGLPELTLPCLGGGPEVDLASLRGPLVVSVWASWCGPCRHEMPILQAFHEQYADQVPLLGIDYEDPQVGAAMALVQETGVTYPLLADPQSSLSAQDPFPPLQGLPYLAILDEDGRVVWHDFEIIESEQELVDLVQAELGVAL